MNLLLWSVQAAVIVVIAAAFAQLLRSIAPGARLAFWQATLLATLLLPVIRPWQQQSITAIQLPHKVAVQVVALKASHAAPFWKTASTEDWLFLILAAGVLIKLALLAAGLFKLRQYRLEARHFNTDPALVTDAMILASDAVSSPVTFGFLNPIILVPISFAELDPALREPILFHEILHVRRRDWLFALAEETLRSLLWFHPGIWYAVREIQLAREETVDREVVTTMNAREYYVDALLAVAKAVKGPELATAPFFLRRSHLKRRVISIFREAQMSRMSKTKSVSALLTACAAMAVSCWFITGALPLKAQPQEVIDGPGVTVDMNGARLTHRSPIIYPDGAIAANVQGSVTAQVKLDSKGNVIDATITSGPDELRKAVLQSVLSWHFTSDSANGTRQIAVGFSLPKGVPAPVFRVMPAAPAAVTANARTIVRIIAPDDLLPKLPIHEGDLFTPELRAATLKVAKEYDEHIMMGSTITAEGATLRLQVPGPNLLPTPQRPELTRSTDSASSDEKPARIGGAVQAHNLVNQVKPIYPELAKAARVQGTVTFDAVIGKDGLVRNLHLISGPPLLVQAAMQAVQQWTYKPTLLNGNPVEVATTIEVNFTLNDSN